MPLLNTVRAVALFEAAKGTLVLLTGFGALSLIHHDAQRIAEQLVGHLHLNPAKHGLIRFVEAYGLWLGRRWAEWFAAVSGGIYIPFEIYELLQRVTWLAIGALVVNVLIVGLMIHTLLRVQSEDRSSEG